jgi:phosphatidate cytidylyltransferase
VLTRTIVGIILALVGLGIIFLGGPIYFFWTFLISLLMSAELFNMVFHRFRFYMVLGTALFAGMVFLAFPADNFSLWLTPFFHFMSIGVVVYCLFELLFKRIIGFKNNIWSTIRIFLLLSFTVPYIYLLREGVNGLANTLFVCVSIWVTDSAAYFGGKLFGRNHMTDISPKKTWEGAAFGVFATVIFAGIFSYFASLNVLLYCVLSIPLSILSQLGDLHESLTKRHFSVKDSSDLLPGHGGVYDRADGYLFVSPIAFYIFNLLL